MNVVVLSELRRGARTRDARRRLLVDFERAISTVIDYLERVPSVDAGRLGIFGPSMVDALFRLATTRWEPTSMDWWEAGRLVRDIGDALGWDRNKRRGFQNDTLIALTARRYGATVVTTARDDFEVLGRALRIAVLPV